MRHALAWVTGLALLLALPAAAVVDRGDDETKIRKVVDGYIVDLSFPTPPRSANDNAIVVKLSTADGRPASGASISVAATAEMAEMGHGSSKSETDAHGAGAAESNDSGDAAKTDGSDEHAGMDMGGSDEHAGMEMGGSDEHAGMDMGGSDEHAGMDMDESGEHAGMDMGGSDEHAGMDMSSGHEEHDKTAGGAGDAKTSHEHHGDASAAHDEPENRGNSEQLKTTLWPGQTSGAYIGSVNIGAGDASQIAVDFGWEKTSHAASFDVELARPRPRALVFGGFAAANFLVLIAAFFVRRREASARRLRTT